MNVLPLISQTNAFKVFQNDAIKSTLSHAYLIVCDDGFMLEEYVKAFVKTLACESKPYCNECRTCRLIDKKTLVDVKFYPTDGKIKVADVDDLIAKSYIKPLEADKKIFVLLNANEMNAQSQNKLLKTLEEPPSDTYIIMGATTTAPILSTVLSRVKRLDIPPFSDELLISVLNSEYNNLEGVEKAVSLSAGKLGDAISAYNSGDVTAIENLCFEILVGMQSSKDAYRFSGKITKDNYRVVLSIIQRVVRDVIALKAGSFTCKDEQKLSSITEVARNYNYGALIYMANKFNEIEKKVNFNLNLNAVIDGILFGILEGKHKWQKL